MGIIETRYGIINNISEEEEIFFKVLLVGVDKDGKYHKTEEVKEIKCENDFTPYMAGQYSLVSISREEFLGLIEDNLENNFEEVFTFKIIEGKIVQIYQGISIPETPSTKIYPG